MNDGYRFKPMRKAAVPILISLVATTFVVFRREVLGDIWLRLNEVPRVALLPLALAAMGMVFARGMFLAACSPGVSVR